MKPVLIQDQTPSKVICDGVEYESVGRFIFKKCHNYNKKRKNKIYKVIYNNFKLENKCYDIDKQPLKKAYFFDYVNGIIKTTKDYSIGIKYNNIYYYSMKNFKRKFNIKSSNFNNLLYSIDKSKVIDGLINLDLKENGELKEKIKEFLKLNSIRTKDGGKKVFYKNRVFNSYAEVNRILGKCKSYLLNNCRRLGIDTKYGLDLNDIKNKPLTDLLEKDGLLKYSISFKEHIERFAYENELPPGGVLDFCKLKGWSKIKDLPTVYNYYQSTIRRLAV
jgi:hypothetical protein